MHFDFIHAAISAALMLGTLWALRRFNVISGDRRPGFDWKIFLAVLAVMFVFNLLWPAAGPT